MKIVIARPPLWKEIDAEFHVAGQPVIFAWDDTIYNPEDADISLDLMAHEKVHGWRQRGEPTIWWRRYIADPNFRLAEEIPAHRAEYQAFCRRNIDRNARARFLNAVAGRLCSPLYGKMISMSGARDAILHKPTTLALSLGQG